jgi:predicted protein tyrosine phosphatase
VTIFVSSLGGLAELAASLPAFDLLTLLSPGAEPRDWGTMARIRHVELAFPAISEPAPNLVAPDIEAVRAILEFGRGAVAGRPLLIHCWAGISRSSAAAYAIACDRNPGHEAAIAQELRRRSPYVTPNKLIVSLVDDILGRDGRMVAAIATIGRGADAAEGLPYQLPLDWPS